MSSISDRVNKDLENYVFGPELNALEKAVVEFIRQAPDFADDQKLAREVGTKLAILQQKILDFGEKKSVKVEARLKETSICGYCGCEIPLVWFSNSNSTGFYVLQNHKNEYVLQNHKNENSFTCSGSSTMPGLGE